MAAKDQGSSSDKSRPMFTSCCIQGKTCNVRLDDRVPESCGGNKLYNMLEKQGVAISSLTGEGNAKTYTAVVDVGIQGQTFSTPFVLSPFDFTNQVTLGADFLKLAGVSMDTATQEWSLVDRDDNVVPLVRASGCPKRKMSQSTQTTGDRDATVAPGPAEDPADALLNAFEKLSSLGDMLKRMTQQRLQSVVPMDAQESRDLHEAIDILADKRPECDRAIMDLQALISGKRARLADGVPETTDLSGKELTVKELLDLVRKLKLQEQAGSNPATPEDVPAGEQLEDDAGELKGHDPEVKSAVQTEAPELPMKELQKLQLEEPAGAPEDVQTGKKQSPDEDVPVEDRELRLAEGDHPEATEDVPDTAGECKQKPDEPEP